MTIAPVSKTNTLAWLAGSSSASSPSSIPWTSGRTFTILAPTPVRRDRLRRYARRWSASFSAMPCPAMAEDSGPGAISRRVHPRGTDGLRPRPVVAGARYPVDAAAVVDDVDLASSVLAEGTDRDARLEEERAVPPRRVVAQAPQL